MKNCVEPPWVHDLLFYQQTTIIRSEKTIWDLAVEERNKTENHSNRGISNLDVYCKCIVKPLLYVLIFLKFLQKKNWCVLAYFVRNCKA